jgi:hypothetical protein
LRSEELEIFGKEFIAGIIECCGAAVRKGKEVRGWRQNEKCQMSKEHEHDSRTRTVSEGEFGQQPVERQSAIFSENSPYFVYRGGFDVSGRSFEGHR